MNKKSFYSREEIEEYQYSKLKDILEYSYQNVPYYQELFDKIKFHPKDFNSLEDLKKIPYLDKNLAQKNQEKLISRTFPERHIKKAETGGTTGLPMDFVLDGRTSSLIEMVYLSDMWKRVNYKRYDRCIVLREDTVSGIIEGKKYWKRSLSTNFLTMSAFHLNADTFKIFYDKIISYKPKFIIAFPSNAFLLAKLIKENNLPNIPGLKAVICSSENMYDWQRTFMEEVYKVRIFSYYGHSEKCALAVECKNSTIYEFYPYYGFVELINKKDEYCTRENERGEIVVTGFNNYAAPFIRYKTDDIGIFTNEHCERHPNWLTIKKVEGRKQDFLIDRDNIPKTYIHIDRPFWEIRDKIYAYQYIQDTPGNVLLNIHAKERLNEKQIRKIKEEFLKTYFKFDLEVQQIDNIPRTKRGKFKYLIQNIKHITQ